MAEGIRPNAFVQTNNKEMEAYLQVPFPENEEKYTIAYLQTLLEQNGIRFGINQAALKRIIEDEEQHIKVFKQLKNGVEFLSI